MEKYPLESVVHNLIFPMRRTSNDILYSQQNLWLIDERLSYRSFIVSARRAKLKIHILPAPGNPKPEAQVALRITPKWELLVVNFFDPLGLSLVAPRLRRRRICQPQT
jgi:hypothetical protein